MTSNEFSIGFDRKLLAGKVVAVTGSAHGIGMATLLLAARLGAAVVGIDMDIRRQASLREMLTAEGHDHLCFDGSIGEPAFLNDVAEQITGRWGRLHGWVNSAFADSTTALEDLALEDWTTVWNVNVTSAVYAAQLTLPLFRMAGGGSIVNVSSVLARRTRRNRLTYAATKAALEGLTRSLAFDLAVDRVRVNTVLPGAVETGKSEASANKQFGSDASSPQRQAALRLADLVYAHHQPLSMIGRPEHVANAIVFLLSDLAAFITGVELPVDGGYLVDGRTDTDPSVGEFRRQWDLLNAQTRLGPA